MKITNNSSVTGNYEQQVYAKETAESKVRENQEQQSSESTTETQKSDTVSLSTASKELQTVKKAAVEAPEERSARVEELKQAVAQGTYTVEPEKVAESIIGTNISAYV